MEDRVSCFGHFDREDVICLVHCALHFECAAAREQSQAHRFFDESLETMPLAYSA
ncbi:hypothetical protein Deba_0926 [Desulfarculus baarsii DSM 2075]|uniref:Uncharacterized protein n=2 Tax=Desulfarculus baarsii TaxID=453230 RepID=E1QFG0_DESB2|nr:hypothetical protein Deba_0926 [Desulfarculus baarsii DSM 2075]